MTTPRLDSFSSFFHSRLKKGFGLPEVAIATAIAGLAFTTLMGIIPSGLNTLRQAGDVTVKARIVQEISGIIQISDWGREESTPAGWSGLSNILAQRWYFDDQANQLDRSDPDFDMRLSYVASAQLAPPPQGGSGSGGSVRVTKQSAPSPDAKALQILTVTSNNPAVDIANSKSLSTSTVIVARQFSLSN